MTAADFVRLVRGLRIALFGVPHRHRWETFAIHKVYEGTRRSDALPIAHDHYLRCRGCGELKKSRL